MFFTYLDIFSETVGKDLVRSKVLDLALYHEDISFYKKQHIRE